MNIVIPMAGEGSRFAKAGYTTPKPLIPVFDKTMIEMVVENNLYPDRKLNFIFIVRESHLHDFPMYDTIYKVMKLKNGLSFNVESVEKLTEGAACSVLKVRSLINNDDELVIANSDQYCFWSPKNFMNMIDITKADGAIPCFPCSNPKWSYVKIDEDGWVTQLREKEVISNLATVGIYYFKHGSDFIRGADKMINKNIRVNNEFYVAPTYEQLIMPENYKVLAYPIPALAMGRLGTPEDLIDFRNRYKDYV